MFKYIIAAVVAFTPTAASAGTVYLDLDRMNVITEAARTICRASMDKPGNAGTIMDRESSYLRLTSEERLYLYSLCVLYAQGRVDAR